MRVPTKLCGKIGQPIVTCTGKTIGKYKRKRKASYTRPGKCKVIKSCG